MLRIRHCHFSRKSAGEQPHETGKANDLDPVFLEERLDFVFKTVAISTEFCVIDESLSRFLQRARRGGREPPGGWILPIRFRRDNLWPSQLL